jgi:hypothetical protein
MSWHIGGVVVQAETPEREFGPFLVRLGFGTPTPTESLGFDDAIDAISEEGFGVAVGCAEGWTSAWGELLVVSDEALREASKDTRLMYFLTDGRSATHMFEWWVDGARLRKRAYQDGAVFDEEGQPLPQEVAVFKAEQDEEERIFLLVSKLCLPFRWLTRPRFQLFEVDE